MGDGPRSWFRLRDFNAAFIPYNQKRKMTHSVFVEFNAYGRGLVSGRGINSLFIDVVKALQRRGQFQRDYVFGLWNSCVISLQLTRIHICHNDNDGSLVVQTARC